MLKSRPVQLTSLLLLIASLFDTQVITNNLSMNAAGCVLLLKWKVLKLSLSELSSCPELLIISFSKHKAERSNLYAATPTSTDTQHTTLKWWSNESTDLPSCFSELCVRKFTDGKNYLMKKIPEISQLVRMIWKTRSNYSWDVLAHFQLIFAVIWTLRRYHDLACLLSVSQERLYDDVVFVVLSRDYSWGKNEVIQINL